MHDWITQMVAIAILFGFIEQLVHDSPLRSYIRLVIGFMMLLVILQPVIGIVQQKLEWQLPSSQTSTAFASNQEFTGKQTNLQELGMSVFCAGLERQAESIAGTVPEVNEVQATVKLGMVDKNVYPKIESVSIRFSRGTQIHPIRPVCIGRAPEKDLTLLAEQRIAKAIRERVSQAFGLRGDQVRVQTG